MAKRIFLFLMMALLLPLPALAQEATTTILIYMCGSDLETVDRSASDDIREMIRCGMMADGPITLALETGGAEEWHLRAISNEHNQRFTIDGEGLHLVMDTLSRRNMGSAATLADFIHWGMKHYPADRTILILWNHGGGALEGICFDELYRDDALTLSELEGALQKGLSGKRLDAIAMDACLMGGYEVAAALAPYARYLAASEEEVPGIGMEYQDCLQALVKNPDMSTLEFCSLMADSMIEEAESVAYNESATFSVIDLDKIAPVTKALDDLGEAGLKLMDGGGVDALLHARQAVLSFGEFLPDGEASDLVDIQRISQELKNLLPKEATALSQAARGAVAYNRTTRNLAEYAAGLSLFWPQDTVADYPEYLARYPSLTGSEAYGAFAVRMGELAAEADVKKWEYDENGGESLPSVNPGIYPGLWDELPRVEQTEALDAEGETEASVIRQQEVIRETVPYPGLWDELPR